MGRLRATLSRSSADRELHTHLARAHQAVRAALAVCAQASRSQASEDAPYRDKLARLAKAERLIGAIGHLEGTSEEVDIKQEARALCSWLEGRERSAGVSRPSRRGQEYQDRLRRVLGFLEGKDVVPEEEPESVEEEPELDSEALPTQGVLWQRALEIARQQGEEGNDGYVLAIFRRLVGGVVNG